MAWWRAWYADGSSVTSDESTWHDLPADGLIIWKVWWDEHRKGLFCGHDSIWWDGEGQVYQLDLPEPFHEVAAAEAAAGRLKRGVYIDSEAYAAVYEEALAAQRG